MPILKRPDAEIYYEVHGKGFPLLLYAIEPVERGIDVRFAQNPLCFFNRSILHAQGHAAACGNAPQRWHHHRAAAGKQPLRGDCRMRRVERKKPISFHIRGK